MEVLAKVKEFDGIPCVDTNIANIAGEQEIALPVVLKYGQQCVATFGGFNGRFGATLLVATENQSQPDGVKFARGASRKPNGKHSYVPVRSGMFIMIGKKSNSYIINDHTSVFIYQIKYIAPVTIKKMEFDMVIAEQVEMYNSVLKKNINESKYRRLVDETIYSLCSKNLIKPTFTNAWESSSSAIFEYGITNLEEILNNPPSKEYAFHQIKDVVEDEFVKRETKGPKSTIVKVSYVNDDVVFDFYYGYLDFKKYFNDKQIEFELYGSARTSINKNRLMSIPIRQIKFWWSKFDIQKLLTYIKDTGHELFLRVYRA